MRASGQVLVFGDTDKGFSFSLKDTLEIFGMVIDKCNKLNFSKHISNVCKRLKINLCYVALSKTHTQGHLSKKLCKAYIL